MNDWQDEFEVVCASRELSWCEANCADECAARAAMVDDLRTANGGWTRQDLQRMGVSWPPQKGWRKALVARERAA